MSIVSVETALRAQLYRRQHVIFALILCCFDTLSVLWYPGPNNNTLCQRSDLQGLPSPCYHRCSRCQRASHFAREFCRRQGSARRSSGRRRRIPSSTSRKFPVRLKTRSSPASSPTLCANISTMALVKKADDEFVIKPEAVAAASNINYGEWPLLLKNWDQRMSLH